MNGSNDRAMGTALVVAILYWVANAMFPGLMAWATLGVLTLVCFAVSDLSEAEANLDFWYLLRLLKHTAFVVVLASLAQDLALPFSFGVLPAVLVFVVVLLGPAVAHWAEMNFATRLVPQAKRAVGRA